MSNPFKTSAAPRNATERLLETMPHFKLSQKDNDLMKDSYGKHLKDGPTVERLFSGKSYTIKKSVTNLMIKPHTFDKTIPKLGEKKLAAPFDAGGDGVPQAREYSTPARLILGKSLHLIPSRVVNPAAPKGWSREEVVEAMENKVLIKSCSSACSVQRVALQLPPMQMGAEERPVTEAEARLAFRMAGKAPAEGVLEKVKLRTLDEIDLAAISMGEAGLAVNQQASLGLPYLTKPAQNPAAVAECIGVLKTLEKKFQEAYDSGGSDAVFELYDKLEDQHPELFYVIAASKADLMARKKVVLGLNRHYCIWPGHLKWYVSQVVQAFSECQKSALEGSTSAQKVAVQHGGIDRLVAAMDAQLEKWGFAFLTNGDDNVVGVTYEMDGETWLLVLEGDATGFDNSQRGMIFRELDREAERQLARIPGGGARAAVWRRAMSRRVEVISGSLCMEFYDGAPSGFPGVSNMRNDPAMTVCLNRLIPVLKAQDPRDLSDRLRVNELCLNVGKTLGIEFRVENHFVMKVGTMRDAFKAGATMMFNGQVWHYDKSAAMVAPFSDLTRALSSFIFPAGANELSDAQFELNEAARMVAVIHSLGVPPVGWRAFVENLRYDVETFAIEAVARHPLLAEKELAWVNTLQFEGQEELPAKPKGVLATLAFAPEFLWLGPKGMVEAKRPVQGNTVLARFAAAKLVPIPPVPRPAKGTSRRNWGRTPPTAPPRAVEVVLFDPTVARSRRRENTKDSRVDESRDDYGDLLPEPSRGRRSHRRR